MKCNYLSSYMNILLQMVNHRSISVREPLNFHLSIKIVLMLIQYYKTYCLLYHTLSTTL